ncbi:hypothetical protein CRG98_014958 [Punica granatum]|uniref:Uncharacterized protein n=1 Tax=Punica granatum TaxID=22663 RepID=A0A2I0K7Z0_PUNGR|nr:hypothetical protein CRG98_014958 [Punica granatum]
MGLTDMGLQNEIARKLLPVAADEPRMRMTVPCFLPAETASRNFLSSFLDSPARSSGDHEVDSRWPDDARFVRSSRKKDDHAAWNRPCSSSRN